MTAIIFIIVLAVLIFVHELGHFVFAKWNGIRVDQFKIGFGPKLVEWGKGETRYGINLIPFGGYVKIHGEDPDEDSLNGPDKARSFATKSRWRQASVLVAGVLFNFIFAWVLYVIVFVSGVTATTDSFERYASDFTDRRVMITYVTPDSPADKAGIMLGDLIDLAVSVDADKMLGAGAMGQASSDANDHISSTEDQRIKSIQDAINSSGGKAVDVKIVRNGSIKTVSVIPVKGLVDGKYAIGISMSDVGDLRLPFFASIYEGAHYAIFMIRDTAVGLYTFVANLFKGTANLSDVAGPVGIAGIVGSAAKLGFSYLLMITALISVNLGVINLVPFPALDGGRVLFVAIEGIIRRRISHRFANTLNAVGFGLLMILMILVTYQDIARLLK